MDRTLNSGDDYYSPQRPVFEYTLMDFSDPESPIPFDMAGSTIMATFKTEPDGSADDSSAPLKADITFASNGDVSSTTNWALPAGNTAADGILHLVADSAATAALPIDTPLVSDVRIVDAQGRNHTVRLIGTLVTQETITNRGS